MNDNMAANYAKTRADHLEPMNVLFVVYPNIVLLDLVGPLQVFTHARRHAGDGPAYRPHVVSAKGGRIPTNTHLHIDSDPIGDWLAEAQAAGECAGQIHTLMIIGGDGAHDASADGALVADIAVLADRAARVGSVCSGALVLAAAGLLDGRRAVTHWEDCADLAARYPAVNVEVDPIFIRDGKVWTSAGITAGVDMSLAMIGEDLGKPAAIEMARSLVTPMVRSGGQSQFSAELDKQALDVDGTFSRLHEWLTDSLQHQITVEDMARECAMSSRNFSRRYSEIMHVSPAKALEAMRVGRARDLLATTNGSIKSVAVKCGFQDDERMRRAFVRVVHTTPSEYRKQFQSVPA